MAGGMVALLLGWALVFNLTQLPYTMWFEVVMFSVFPIACLLGFRLGKKRPIPAVQPEGARRSP
jgi:hypothetical protein